MVVNEDCEQRSSPRTSKQLMQIFPFPSFLTIIVFPPSPYRIIGGLRVRHIRCSNGRVVQDAGRKSATISDHFKKYVKNRYICQY